MYNIFIWQEKYKEQLEKCKETCYWKLIFVISCEHVVTQSMQDTLAREHVSTQGTLAREHVSTQGTLVRKHVST